MNVVMLQGIREIKNSNYVTLLCVATKAVIQMGTSALLFNRDRRACAFTLN